MNAPVDWGRRWGVARATSGASEQQPGQGWMHAFDYDRQVVACGMPGEDYTVYRGARWLHARLAVRCPRCEDIVFRWLAEQQAGPRAREAGQRIGAWAKRRPLRPSISWHLPR